MAALCILAINVAIRGSRPSPAKPAMLSSAGWTLRTVSPAPIDQHIRACMKTGFLTLETHPEHSGMVRVRMRDIMPELTLQPDGTCIRYVARFDDVEAGQMHVQNAMHGRLVDVENRIYRSDLDEMIACVEADDLDHVRIWIDPEISGTEGERIESLARRLRRRHRVVDRIWQTVGILGLLYLLIMGLNP
jgi:hypothetical protein